MKDDALYVVHIGECIHRIETYVKEGREAFFRSSMLQDAVMRNFEIIGEAAKHVSVPFQQAHSQIPWRRLAGFRDVLIHDYMGVDVEEVWNIVEQHLPGLTRDIDALTRALPQPPS
jgi:uncharacterized protein with HEPN domain